MSTVYSIQCRRNQVFGNVGHEEANFSLTVFVCPIHDRHRTHILLAHDPMSISEVLASFEQATPRFQIQDNVLRELHWLRSKPIRA